MKSDKKSFFDKSRDKIAIVAPSSKTQNCDETVERGIKFFESRDIEAFLAKNSFGEHHIHANAVEKRLDRMLEGLNDDAIKIIWCFRGGSGSSEVAYYLNIVNDKCAIQVKCPKILVGFSDTTALHIFFNQKLNLQSIHGSMITNIEKTEKNLDMVLDLFDGKEITLGLEPINTVAEKFIKNNNSVQAKIGGGNLTVLCANIGTNNHPNFDDKILFLEDIGEPSYKVDRNLFHLFASNVINKRLKAIVFGDFKDCDNHKKVISEFIEKCLVNNNIPCFKAKDCGHSEINIPIVFNSENSEIAGETLTYSIQGEIV